MAEVKFTITLANVKDEMRKVWDMANKGLKAGDVIVTLGREGQTDLQSKCYHAMLGDIAKQVDLGDKKYDLEVWKGLLVSDFAKEKHEMGEPLRRGNKWVPSLCGTHMVPIRPSTKDFRKAEGSDFIEYLMAKGAEYDVQYTDYAMKSYEQYREANG